MNTIIVSSETFEINGSDFEYTVEDRKIGKIFVVPAIFESDGSLLKASDAEGHFYRIIKNPTETWVRIHDQNGFAFNLLRERCSPGVRES
ncbi:hypothetical protein Q9K02_10595 [Qipengyuania sp. G39]|uniref:Uncharacterized protein n=1 Tax=Qipengyuania profundimaris TaxID=3067652 RepID=A0ABT9HRE7_9SPHN|nr:hypothetical protein [Qipengyuania sp. G39]MDP4575585.1 hypothetical protein [Qipengyuania sp. G39]